MTKESEEQFNYTMEIMTRGCNVEKVLADTTLTTMVLKRNAIIWFPLL